MGDSLEERKSNMLSWKEPEWEPGSQLLPQISIFSMGNEVLLALVDSPIKGVYDSITGNWVLLIHSKNIY